MAPSRTSVSAIPLVGWVICCLILGLGSGASNSAQAQTSEEDQQSESATQSSAAEKQTVRIPGATAYIEPNPEGALVSDEGVSRWKGDRQSVVWFGDFQGPGEIHADLVLELPNGTESQLELSVGSTSHTITAKSMPDTSEIRVSVGSFQISEVGFHRFVLKSKNGADRDNGRVKQLILSGRPIETSHFNLDPRRNAASVHLAYPVTGKLSIAWFYSEVTAVEDPTTTFYMACGFRRGYFGMQVNSPTERRIIFSVWDSGSGGNANDRREVSEDNHVSLVGKGDDVHTSVFGGEGTGGHSHLKYLWKTGEPQRFLVSAEPVPGEATIYTGYYFHPEKQKWVLISSMKAPKDGKYLQGLHGFSENFWGTTGHLQRKARYGNQWIMTEAGEWQELTVATFSHDPTGKTNRRDRFMGVENGEFFLSHGGFIKGWTKFGERFERPAIGRHPEITAADLPPR